MIKIISLYGKYNYGNRLQNYAVQKLAEKYGEVRTIKNDSYFSKYNILMNIKKLFNNNVIEKERKRNFEIFNKNIRFDPIYIDRKFVVKSLLKRDDIYLFGSDQIWNYGSKGPQKLYLGYYTPCENNIAISASFGVDSIPDKFKDTYSRGFNNFKHISVRENEGKKIINNINKECNVEVLLDPTMLIDKQEWCKLEKQPMSMMKEKYILTYFLGEQSEARRKAIKQFALRENLKIINLMDKEDKYYVSGPAEFLYLERNASLICTDSFHSAVFAIINKVPFLVFNREDGENDMNSRLNTLLNKFNLNNNYLKETEIPSDILKMKFTDTDSIIENEKEKMQSFLKKVLI